MEEFPRLSNREWDVLKLVLQGKSNKLIAVSLGISIRTVEFHLRNIYAKFGVSSRIELILKLGNATGELEALKLGHSTVAQRGKTAENRDRLNLWVSWAKSSREAVSIIGKELAMNKLLSSKDILISIATAILVGLLWVIILENTVGLSVEDFAIFIVPFFIILAMIGTIIGAIGKQRQQTLLKVLLSVIFGTGLSPFMVIPLMRFIVIPVGRLVANFGVFDPSTVPGEIASNIAMGIMITLWFIASTTLGIVLIMLSFNVRPANHHGQIEESA